MAGERYRSGRPRTARTRRRLVPLRYSFSVTAPRTVVGSFAALIARALTMLTLATLLVLVGTLALMVSDELPLLPALFEVTSAFGTAGMSLGVTPELSAFAKVLVAAIMLVGRVGPLVLLLALSSRQRPINYRYPEEDIALG